MNLRSIEEKGLVGGRRMGGWGQADKGSAAYSAAIRLNSQTDQRGYT